MPEIANNWPPNIAVIREALPVTRNNIFAYGGKIYSPGSKTLSPELIAHEQVHFRQQDDDPDAWWDRFLKEPKFRLQQELEAHRAEYHCLMTSNTPRSVRRRALKEIASRLSAPMYGRIITTKQAMAAIR